MADNINSLIDNGLKLAKNIRKYNGTDPYKTLDKILDYHSWRLDASHYFKSVDIDDRSEDYVYELDTLTIDPVGWVKLFLNKKTSAKATNIYITNIERIIKILESYESKIQNKNEKIPIYLSDKNGLHRKKDTKILKYTISGNRLILVRKIHSKKDNSGLELASLYRNSLPDLSKAIKEINKNFKQNLRLKENLIYHSTNGGYFMNENDYSINF